MFQQILTIKASIAVLILLATAALSSWVTYDLVHQPAVVAGLSPCAQIPAQQATRKPYLHEVKFNTHDGKRY